MTQAFFAADDLSPSQLPAPGYYAGSISQARFRRSAKGNQMLRVLVLLDGVNPAHELLADYFVLDGATPRGVYMARRRLVELYRACGFDPKDGDPIRPEVLLNARLEVKVVHDHYDNSPRLRASGYRPLGPPPF